MDHITSAGFLGRAAVVAYGIHPAVPSFQSNGMNKVIGGQSEHGKRRAG
jgi:hypothetical protein